MQGKHMSTFVENKKEAIKVLEKNISRGFQALVMGLWLDQLVDPETFSKKKANEGLIKILKRII